MKKITFAFKENTRNNRDKSRRCLIEAASSMRISQSLYSVVLPCGAGHLRLADRSYTGQYACVAASRRVVNSQTATGRAIDECADQPLARSFHEPGAQLRR